MEQQQIQEQDTYEVQRLQLEKIDGFNGKVKHGLKVHPDRQNIIYPLGSSVVIENISGNGRPSLLCGHTSKVTCIAISNKNGDFIASGQETYSGFKAIAIVWDYRSQTRLHTLELHKVKVQALVFSPNDLYLATLGGLDDGCIVIWDVQKGKAICGSPAQVESAGDTLCVEFSNVRDDVFVTGGDSTLRVWELDVENRKIRPSEVDMGQIKRKIQCICMDDPYFYCGTATGDILAINMKTKRFQYKAPEKQNFQSGVTALAHLKNSNFLVGTGCGQLFELKFPLPGPNDKKQPKPKEVRSWSDESVKSASGNGITSIALRGAGHQFFVGTENARMYKFGYECSNKSGAPMFDSCELIKSCHSSEVTDVIFPPASSDLIVTCQKEQIRIWAIKNMKELKRHIVPNMTCNAIALACNGQAIVSAWDDGIIRVFGFGGKSGNDIVLRKIISAAHSKGVSAIACTQNSPACGQGQMDFRIISGGGEGQVRIWNFRYDGRNDPSCELEETLKEHKGSVSDIKIKGDDRECVSSSADGTSIIWDLDKKSRSQIVFANTLFKCVCYNKDETQIVTSGSDRKIGYWERYDGSIIRSIEGSMTGSINAMDISPDGQYIVTGGDDKLLKVWSYKEGEVIAVGTGHSGKILRIRICPQQRYICSVGEDGGILLWKFPF
ncbi:cilia- and flagella-associated protein 52-like [Mercenaria mercenaria]|uniref:cilia- and flagella-associated protein 52-like n=1 Tax=Mercenaria mercenaria TaxID=6596 RepID=UPI00234E582A|nr:cilia- and flagella-associated protein 52-like [Mercenaria mercenaria]